MIKFNFEKQFPYVNDAKSNILATLKLIVIRDGFGPGPAQPKSARAYIPTWPKVGPGPKVAQRTLAQIGLGPNIFGPGPAQEIVGPDKWS